MALDLTEGKPRDRILAFTVPLVLGNLINQVYTIADSVIVGRLVGINALAAVGASAPVTFFFTAALGGFLQGTTIITSRFYGAKDIDGMRSAISTAFFVIMGLTVLLTGLGFFTSQPLLLLLNTHEDIIGDSNLYLRWMFGGLVFQSFYFFLVYILRGIGDSKTPLYFLIIASILNIVLDLVLVIVFEMGVAGVALATVIAQGVSAFLCAGYTFNKYEMLRFRLKDMVFIRSQLYTIFNYGVPASVSQITGSLGMMLLQGLVNSFGKSATAAFSSAYKIDNFLMLPIMNIGIALSGYTSQNLGAKKYERLKEGLNETLKLCTIFCVVVAGLIFIFSKELCMMFLDPSETEAIKYGSDCLRALSPPFFICGLFNCYVSYFRGLGKNRFVMVVTILHILTRILFAYGLTSQIGIWSIWLCMPFSWIVCITICIIRYKRYDDININNLRQE